MTIGDILPQPLMEAEHGIPPKRMFLGELGRFHVSVCVLLKEDDYR